MEFEQVKFQSLEGVPGEELGGIAAYKYGHFLGVICGCCGRWIKASNVILTAKYPDWLNIGEAIVEINDEESWPDDDGDEFLQ